MPSRPPAACPEAMLDLPSSHAAGVSGPITEAACGSGGSGGVLSRAPKARSRSHVFAATMRPSRNEPRAGRAQPRILAEGRPGYRDVSTLVLRPEPRGSGPIPRLFISSDLLSGAKRLCGARLGRDSWQGQTEARCTMRFPISSKPGHSIPQWRQPKKKKENSVAKLLSCAGEVIMPRSRAAAAPHFVPASPVLTPSATS